MKAALSGFSDSEMLLSKNDNCLMFSNSLSNSSLLCSQSLHSVSTNVSLSGSCSTFKQASSISHCIETSIILGLL